MPLRDYRKLCPKSGHALTASERRTLDAEARPAGRARRVRCDACGREVELCADPGTGRSLLYAIHLKDGVDDARLCGTGAA